LQERLAQSESDAQQKDSIQFPTFLRGQTVSHLRVSPSTVFNITFQADLHGPSEVLKVAAYAMAAKGFFVTETMSCHSNHFRHS
jgi:hypothetical protein